MAPEVPLNWSLVIPVKVLAQAKSRLTGLAGQRRSKLALAMAADTVEAAAAADGVATVLVVTDDPEVSSAAAELGAVVLRDEPAVGLNEALAHGAAYAQERWRERGIAALAADLPALQPRELAIALATASRHGAAFVPDALGTGTTLYATTPGAAFQPLFGDGSRQRHLAAGVSEIDLGPAQTGLRQDVDTIADLRQAAAIGLGPRTRAILLTSGLDVDDRAGERPGDA
jgi:2-phospho-L-lactate/phosphoenolpyruvate guanylyltransferase